MACTSQENDLKEGGDIVCLEDEKSAQKDLDLHKPSLIDLIDSCVLNKVNIQSYVDSLTKQSNVSVLDTLEGVFCNKDKPIYDYRWENEFFRLELDHTDSSSNTIFYHGNTIIDFSNHSVLTYNTEEYESETFGFNYFNTFYNLLVIEVSNEKFLYSDISHNCNGKGCGCQLNFIYHIESGKAFFIDNYRFPYNGFYLSDFNIDGVIDLLVIGRKKDIYLKNLPIFQLGYQITWFEFIEQDFKVKRGKSGASYTYEFVKYSGVPELYYDDLNFGLSYPGL